MGGMLPPEQAAKTIATFLASLGGMVDYGTVRRNYESRGGDMKAFVRGLTYGLDRDWIRFDCNGVSLILTDAGRMQTRALFEVVRRAG